MVDGVIQNIYLVNAPAGSGKTTWIRKEVENHLLQNPNDNILCITFTNRAAEELGRDIESNRVFFGTIHSFINDFISSFFSHNSIIDLYWEVYKDNIKERIENVENREVWTETNERYKEKYGALDMDTVHSNIDSISYNEAPFNSLYRGALSHDDLISFTRLAVDRFPVIKKKIADKFQLIFIDEYQDTSADVLHIFYTAVFEKKTKLYLLGDKMQQIYKNYNGEFEEQFKLLNKSIRLSKNYRTTPKIVEILNAIYNDDTLEQTPYENNCNESMSFQPRVLIVNDTDKAVSDFRNTYNDALILYLSNKARFDNIGAGEIYDALSKMDKYQFGRKYTVVDALTKEEARSSDSLLTFLFTSNLIVKGYKQGLYGKILKTIQKSNRFFDSEKLKIKSHSDKAFVRDSLNIIVNSFTGSSTTVDDFLNICLTRQLITNEFYSAVTEDDDYQFVKKIKVHEVELISDYLDNPLISTQHGVKGESHDTVVFVAENSHNPPVNMSKFFELWSTIEISLSEFDAFYYSFSRMIQEIENSIGMKCSKLKKESFETYIDTIEPIIQSYISENEANPYYIHLLKDNIDKYSGKKNVTNAKAFLRESIVYGPLCAYRLFYVGCSRARKNLAIIINKLYIKDFENNLFLKFQRCGFEVYTE